MQTPNAHAAVVRSTSVRPSLFRLVLDGFREALSRRRLIRYLVQADLKKKGSDTALGNVWWVLDPLLQMIVYVVLVSVIFSRSQPRLPAVHLRRDPALEVVHDLDRRRHRLGGRARNG